MIGMRGLGGLAGLTLVALLTAGCTSRSDGPRRSHHAHPEAGPRDGVLAEGPEEDYHAEFLVDHDKKEVTVYVLDDSARKDVPIEAESITVTISNLAPMPVSITLKPSPQDTDPKGQSSRFVGNHDQLAEKKDYKGEISLKIKDKPYVLEFDESKGGGHEHKK